MRSFLAFVLPVACSFAGCYFAGLPGKGAQADAGYLAAAPIIAALDTFRHEHGHYPASLRELVPHYVAVAAALQLRGGHVEGFEYHRKGDAYTLGFTYYTAAVNQCSYDSKTKKWDCLGYF
jgi:hypothetical protein